MTNQFTHIADVTVGTVKGNSRTYPQLRLSSQYAERAGKKASIFEIRGKREILLSLSGSPANSNSPANTADEIRKFASLLEDGHITQDEFDEQKKISLTSS